MFSTDNVSVYLSKNIPFDENIIREGERGEGRQYSVESHQISGTQHSTTTEVDTGERVHGLPRPFSRVIISVLQVPGF